MPGVYIHVPFCRRFCTYCDFYSICDIKRVGDYPDSLFREMMLRKDFFRNAEKEIAPDTLYFGGGTPSLLPCVTVRDIAAKAAEIFRNEAPFIEFTVEVNPDDVTEEYAEELREIGVTRVSIGVQSFDDAALRWMNRRHDAEGAEKAFRSLRKAGFGNVSLDLIFGYLLPGETDDDALQRWGQDLEEVLKLMPEHISAYQMSIEEGSILGKMCRKGEYAEPDDELCASQYGMLQDVLAAGGFEQYEISNFARQEEGQGDVSPYRSQHNSAYWTRSPYLGLGPAAHSFRGDERCWNVSDVERYMEGVKAGNLSSVRSSELLTAEEADEEKMMLGLRRREGVKNEDVPAAFVERVNRLVDEGLLTESGGWVRIPPRHYFISDSIIRRII